jgi:hypothetical protein
VRSFACDLVSRGAVARLSGKWIQRETAARDPHATSQPGNVAAGDSEGEQVGESVGGAREGWDCEFGEDGGVVLVVYGGAVVGEREQRDDLDAFAGVS